MPAFKAHIPVIIKNTNNPECQGTLIKKISKMRIDEVVGVASDDGFCGMTIGKYLLNREVGDRSAHLTDPLSPFISGLNICPLKSMTFRLFYVNAI